MTDDDDAPDTPQKIAERAAEIKRLHEEFEKTQRKKEESRETERKNARTDSIKIIIGVAIIFVIVIALLILGHIQTSESTQNIGNAVSGGEILTEHTYLFGDEGFLTKKYDLTIFTSGHSKEYTDLSYSQLQAIGQIYAGTNAGTRTPQYVAQQTTASQGNIQNTKMVALTISRISSTMVTANYVGGRDANSLQAIIFTVNGVNSGEMGSQGSATPLTVGSTINLNAATNSHIVGIGHFNDGSIQVIIETTM
jgi:hypothetical protein